MNRLSPLAISLTLVSATPMLLSLSARAQETTADALPTINVNAGGIASDSYRTHAASVGSFDDASLLDTPASVSVVNQAQLKDQQARLLSDVIKHDASIGENYAPVGYYENIIMRGFALDLASGYQINGMSVAGEQNIALENKEQVEFLKGLASLQGGVSNPGGLVNYVTKRPAEVRSVTAETDSNGSRYLATDLGTFFGEQHQFGLRINAAHEANNSYVDYSNGHRDFASIAATWAINSSMSLQIDADYQNKVQRSVSGYQLLGGTTVPGNVSPTTMLSPQPWAKPVTDNSSNLQMRLDVELSPDWSTYLAASHSRVVIDDNVAFAYGSSSGPYFAANGDFDVYDYRSPDDDRRNDQVQTVLQGKFKTGALKHELTLGASLFRRSVYQTDAVYDYVGTDNIYNSTPLIFSPSPNVPGASYRRLDSRQQSLFTTDRVHLEEHWQIVAGGRQIWLDEKAFDSTGTVTRDTKRALFLPQLALIYQPQKNLSFYTSYSQSLSLGGQAPSWSTVTNANAILAPTVAHQVETGVKYDWRDDVSFTAALFSMNQAYQYAKPDGSGNFTYVQQGTQTNQGLELGTTGNVTRQLQLSASAMLIQARAYDTGTPAYDGQQVINVPHLRTALYADYALTSVQGLNLQGSWLYSGRKLAAANGVAAVPAYHIFNAGLRYKTTLGGHATTLRLTVDNLFNKVYWKDTGSDLGDTYLSLGAPRLARLSVQYDF